MVILGCISAAFLLAFTADTIPAAGYRDCSYSKEDDNDSSFKRHVPEKCDKRYGSKATAEGKVWNISIFEGCAIDYLMEKHPAWAIGRDGVHFWSSKNLSHFNFFDFQSAPAWLFSTDKYSAQTHLGYNESNVGGMKGVVASGARKAMYARSWMFHTGIGLWGVAVVMSVALLFMDLGDTFKLINALVWVLWSAFALFVIASFYYHHLFMTGAMSPLPTDPIEAFKNPDGQGYELIPMKNITFKEHPTRCPKNVAEALNKDPGALYHDSTGIHGASLKYTTLAVGVLTIFPLAVILMMQIRDETREENSKIHFLGLGYFIVFIGLQFGITFSSDMDDRCGDADPRTLAALGATPGSYATHVVNETLEVILHSLALLCAISGVIIDASGMSSSISEKFALNGEEKNILSVLLVLFIFMEAVLFASSFSTTSADLCSSTLTDNGRAVATVQLALAALVVFVYLGYQLLTSRGKEQSALFSKYSAVKTNKRKNADLEMSMI